jgi:Ca2+-transporting ATPase
MARTLTFATVVSMILFIPLAFRSLDKSVFSIGVFSNRLMIAGVTATFFATMSVMYIPKLNVAFGLIPLAPTEWIMPVAVAFVTFLFAEGLKLVTAAVGEK